VSGGALLITKGVGKGITTGDGRAVVSGITQGVASVGNGVGQGVESVVTGAAGGVYSVGMGLFSGVKSVGKGIGGAFVGKKAAKKLGKNR
jgi:phage-related protein